MSTEETNTMNPEDLASLRTAAEEGRKAKRELAFAKAGVPLDSPLGTVFMKGYDGDLDPEKIKEGWAELAPASPIEPGPQAQQQVVTPPASTPVVVDPRVLAQQGGNIDPNARPDLTAIHPGRLGAQMYHEVKQDPTLTPGVTPEDLFFSSVFGAAAANDPRVVGDARKAQSYQTP